MILHFCNMDKFISPFIDFMEENFDDFDDHIFYCVGDKEKFPVKDRVNVIYVDRLVISNLLEFIKLLHKAEKVILHSLFNMQMLRMLALQPWLLKKCYWVIWGGDLYYYKQLKQLTLRQKFNEVIRTFVIKRMGHLITYVPGDVELARKWYGAKGLYHECIMYPSNLFKPLDIPKKRDNTVKIQVGNSADPTNNHFDLLEKLIPYKDEDIEIFAILSYGPKNHAELVIEKGNELFGKKFIPITTFMKPNEYLAFLGDIDIAMFGHRRQQAMGNTITLLGLGKRVYMRSDVAQWKVFANSGINVFEYKDFDLSLMDKELQISNINILKKLYSKENLNQQLSKLFIEK